MKRGFLCLTFSDCLIEAIDRELICDRPANPPIVVDLLIEFFAFVTHGSLRICAISCPMGLKTVPAVLFTSPLKGGRPTEAASRHVAGGSGARGDKSGGGTPGLSTCNLRSAALSNRAAEILGSVVALDNPSKIAA